MITTLRQKMNALNKPKEIMNLTEPLYVYQHFMTPQDHKPNEAQEGAAALVMDGYIEFQNYKAAHVIDDRTVEPQMPNMEFRLF